MHSTDPFGADDDIPELPIPRPSEWTTMPTPAPQPAATPLHAQPLGGGASFTSVGEGDPRPVELRPVEARPVEVRPGPVTPPSDEGSLTWQIAAQLTAGMLANPARAHGSVKDAMALFDQFLQEMTAYERIASGQDLSESEAARRQLHHDWFRRADPIEEPAPATDGTAIGPTAVPPIKPRPAGEYQPIPPGMRGPYAPGSMSGPPLAAEQQPPGQHQQQPPASDERAA